jgi:drug/metabolite transporter (DMT)-like permease
VVSAFRRTRREVRLKPDTTYEVRLTTSAKATAVEKPDATYCRCYDRQMVAAAYALICLIWGSTWLAIKVGLVGVPPFLGAGVRFLLSAAIVGLVLAGRRRRIALTHDDKVCILSLGLMVFWLDYAAVYWAEVHISSGLTAVLFSTVPLTTALLSAFWTRSEALSARKIAGILIGVAGTALLFWPHEELGGMQLLGMLSALAGASCAAINLVVMKKHGKQSDPFVLNFFGMALGAVCLLVMSAALEPWTTVAWTRSNVAALLYLAIFGSVIAFSAYYYLIKRMDATIVSLSTLIIPIVALALGRIFLDETVTPAAVAGIATTLSGVGIAIVPAVRTAPAVPEPASVRRAPL